MTGSGPGNLTPHEPEGAIATVTASTPRADVRSSTSQREDLITALLSLWYMGGLYIDAWVHIHTAKIESIFTPAHAVFYSGFLAISLWILQLVLDRHVEGRPYREAVPVGYEGAMIGMAVFAVSSGADLVWHTIFGFEKGLDALLSPTHLVLFTGVTLIITAPFRSAWARPEPDQRLSASWPLTIALTLATGLWSLDTGYLSTFRYALPAASGDPNEQALAVTRLLATGVLLVVPTLLLLRRWRPPFGVVTVLFAGVALPVGFLKSVAPVWPVLAGVLAGLCLDGLVHVLASSPNTRRAYRIAGTAAPAFLTLFHLAFAAIARHPLAWHFNVLAGAVILSALSGLALSVAMDPGTHSPS
jgi:hypothetical protein